MTLNDRSFRYDPRCRITLGARARDRPVCLSVSVKDAGIEKYGRHFSTSSPQRVLISSVCCGAVHDRVPTENHRLV